MKKISILLIFIIVFIILTNSTNIINSINLSFNICFNNLFPSLIPFILLSNILIKYNIIDELNTMFKFLTKKIFRVCENCAFAIIMSMISGTPSNSKYLKDLYDNNLICLNDVKKCLNFCHFTNPIFIIGTIGVTFLNNKELGLIILISHYLSSFILGIVLKKDNKNNQFYLDKRKQNKNTNNFITILNESIINTANTLLLILGIITFCLIITAIFDKIFNIDNNYKYIYGLLEITQGLKYLSLSNLDIKIKTIIASFIISFGGFCIHLQVFSILDNKKIRYLPYLFSRILQAVMSAIITLLIITLFG